MRGIVPTEMKETADDEQNVADDACKRIPPPFANCTKRAQRRRPARLSVLSQQPALAGCWKSRRRGLSGGDRFLASARLATAKAPSSARCYPVSRRTRCLLLPLALAEAEPRMAIRGTPASRLITRREVARCPGPAEWTGSRAVGCPTLCCNLIIGSAAGVAAMGIEKIQFI